MSTIAVRRTFAVLLATAIAVVACYTVFARDAKAAVRPAPRQGITSVEQPGKSHRPVIGSAVKYVRDDDGTVRRTR
jgi:hypothetical protein